MGLISKTTTSHVRHTYLYIFVLHDYGVKMHNFAFYGEHKRATTKFRACLHGVGDPDLVGLVSFVFTL